MNATVTTPLDELIDRYLIADARARRSAEQVIEAERARDEDAAALASALRSLGEATKVGEHDNPNQRLFALGGTRFLRIWATFDHYQRPGIPAVEIIFGEEIPTTRLQPVIYDEGR
jgi:hypothetical protein